MGVYGSLQRAMGMYTASDNTVGTLAPRKGRKGNNVRNIRIFINSHSNRILVRKQPIMRSILSVIATENAKYRLRSKVMGIYIKGMDRVSDCMYCLFYSHGYCNAKHSKCNSEFGIDADCPIVEVKTPHGRLIDADKLTDKSFESDVFLSDLILETEVYLAPTVIEAEVE